MEALAEIQYTYILLNTRLKMLAEAMPLFFPILITVLGGVVGSLMNCLLFRIPHKKPIRRPASYCPTCQTTLKTIDLIPILSWVMLKGRCRYCTAKIGRQSVLLEGAIILQGIALYMVFGAALTTFGGISLIWATTFSILLMFQRVKS